MPLEIAKIPDNERFSYNEWDKALMRQCRTCKYKKLCGGVSFEDDSRFCQTDCDNGCIVFCCFNNRAVPMLDQLGGPEFDDIKWNPWEFGDLAGMDEGPDFMWVIDDKVNYMHEATYVIPLDRVFTGQGWSRLIDLHKRFEIPRTSKIAISFCVKDWLVEQVWKDRHTFYEMMKAYKFDFVFPLNCSAYRNFPRSDTLVNLKRRMHTLDKLQEIGLKVIPDIWAKHPQDKKRTIKWLKENKVTQLFCTWQTVKGTDVAVRESLQWMVDLRGELGPDVKFYLSGVSMRRARLVKQLLGNVGIVGSMSATMASMKVDLAYNFMRKTGMSAPEIFEFNRNILRDVFYGHKLPPKQGDGGKQRAAEQESKPI